MADDDYFRGHDFGLRIGKEIGRRQSERQIVKWIEHRALLEEDGVSSRCLADLARAIERHEHVTWWEQERHM